MSASQTKDFVYTWQPGEVWYRPGFSGPSAARQYFWDEYQNKLLVDLQNELDQGWEPITQVGPSAIKMRSYEKNAEPDLSDVLFWIATVGLGLLYQLLNPTKILYYEPTEFRVALRRRT